MLITECTSPPVFCGVASKEGRDGEMQKAINSQLFGPSAAQTFPLILIAWEKYISQIFQPDVFPPPAKQCRRITIGDEAVCKMSKIR